MSVPVYRLTCRDNPSALRLVDLLLHRGYVNVSADGANLRFPWGGPADALFEIGGWAHECGLAGDVEVSEFFMQKVA